MPSPSCHVVYNFFFFHWGKVALKVKVVPKRPAQTAINIKVMPKMSVGIIIRYTMVCCNGRL